MSIQLCTTVLPATARRQIAQRRSAGLFIAIGCLLSGAEARATLWDNPSFTAMLADSKLIVAAEIVEGGQMFARARALETFKGEAPTTDFVVTGFNNGCWPKQEWLRQSVKPREQYLFFLQPTRSDEPVGTSFIAWSACGGELSVPKPWKTLPRYAVPTPSMGDYRIDGRGVHSDWQFCSDCSDTLATPSHLVWTQLRALGRPDDADAVAQARGDLGRLLTPELVAKAPTDEVARVSLAWLLEGQAAYGQPNARAALLAAVEVAQPDIRVAAVRALPSLGATQEVLQLLGRLLGTKGVTEASAIQIHATRALAIVDPEGHHAIEMLLGAIADSDASNAVHRQEPLAMLDPWESAREAMIRALSRYRAHNAEPVLVALVRRTDNSPSTLDALLQYFLNFPSPEARAELLRFYASTPNGQLDNLHRYLVDDGDPRGLDAAFNRMLAATADFDECCHLFEYYALHRPVGDARLEAALVRLLGVHGSEQRLARLTPLALTLNNEQLIQRLLHLDGTETVNSDAKTTERVARALLLKRATSSQAELRLHSWVQLLMDDRWSGRATPFLLRESVCSTPDALRPQLMQSFELEDLVQLKQQAVRALEFDPTHRDLRRTPEFLCAPPPARASAPNVPSVASANRNAPELHRGGCSAGCVLAPRVDSPPAVLLAALLACLARLRSRRGRHVVRV